eukprot:614447-Pleurochrysis_carterae.AAC.1
MSTPRFRKLSVQSGSTDSCATMRATRRVVHDRHTGASPHVPAAGDGRPRQSHARIHGPKRRRRNR